MFPPDSTTTIGPSKSCGASIRAATAAAPAGSTTTLARSISASSAVDSASSDTVRTSSTWVLDGSKRHLAGAAHGDPVGHRGHLAHRHRLPGRKRSWVGRGGLGLHPDHADIGPLSLDRGGDAGEEAAAAEWARSTVLIAGHCSRISSPQVP